MPTQYGFEEVAGDVEGGDLGGDDVLEALERVGNLGGLVEVQRAHAVAGAEGFEQRHGLHALDGEADGGEVEIAAHNPTEQRLQILFGDPSKRGQHLLVHQRQSAQGICQRHPAIVSMFAVGMGAGAEEDRIAADFTLVF